MEKYQDVNAKAISRWIKEGWEWGKPISHEDYLKAKNGECHVKLTPTKDVPASWFLPFKNLKILGLASGGGQQMPVFAALGADVTVFDYNDDQLASEALVSNREGYKINIIKGDMSKPLPFEDSSFDLIFFPVSNVYVEEAKPIFKEAYRILKKNGRLLSGLDNGINFITNNDEKEICHSLPFNPLKDEKLYEEMMNDDDGVEFSHTLEEQIGGQLEAGFILKEIYEDTNDEGRLHELNIPSFFATLAIKPL